MDVILHIRTLGLEIVVMMVVAYVAVGWWRVRRRSARKGPRAEDGG